MAKSKVCLIVIDGWGISEEKNGNAIAHAQTPVMTRLSQVPDQAVTLDASGLSVGLPRGLMGNSEVGHLNIGAGRVVWQDITRINLDLENGTLGKNETFLKACQRAKDNAGRLHLLGLISDGGVHSHMDQIIALVKGAKEAGVPKTFVHFFGDGRDTAPASGAGYLRQLLDALKTLGYGEVVDVTGRYYAMDRDKRWERIKVAYEGLIKGTGEHVDNQEDLIKVMNHRYGLSEPDRETDEFFKPIIVNGPGRVQDNDTMVFCNFRSDRMREIVEAFGIKPPFETDAHLKNLGVFCMTQYNEKWTFPLLYPPQNTANTVSECIANNDLNQFHCAETEKYAHVTFFFNGGKEIQCKNEDRCLVPSPKVATYDLLPEMSCVQVADKMVEAIGSGKYQFIMNNFAPPDMVGHTGVYDAAVKAVTATDIQIGRIEEACKQHGYVLLITADHGNGEQMLSPEGKPHTAHTTNRVPFYMTNTNRKFAVPANYNPALCDVAPTVLDLMGLGQPADMTGASLLAK